MLYSLRLLLELLRAGQILQDIKKNMTLLALLDYYFSLLTVKLKVRTSQNYHL